MTFLRQRETSRISSRGKGSVYNTGGGGGRSSPFRRIVLACSSESDSDLKPLTCSSSSSSSSNSLQSSNDIVSYIASGATISSQKQQQHETTKSSGRTRRAVRSWSAAVAAASGPRCRFPAASRRAKAACMIIEDRAAVPRLSSSLAQQRRQHGELDGSLSQQLAAAQPLLDRLVLFERRTAKFSSNRHRKLQPFRET